MNQTLEKVEHSESLNEMLINLTAEKWVDIFYVFRVQKPV